MVMVSDCDHAGEQQWKKGESCEQNNNHPRENDTEISSNVQSKLE